MAFEKTRKKLAETIKKARLKKAYKKEGMDKKAAKAKAKVKAKAPETGKVRKGAKGVKSTKGGEYVKYDKKSKAAKSFRSEFAAARKAGKSSFTWDGRSYSTAMKGDKKKASKPEKTAPKKAAPKKTAPKKAAPSMPESPLGIKKYEAKPGQKSTLMRNNPKNKTVSGGSGEERLAEAKYSDGGKVESNPFGWPSRDARNGGNK